MGLCRGGHLPAKQLILKFLLPNHSVIYIWKHLRLFFPPALLLYSCSVLNFILIFWCKALRPTSSPRYTFSALLLLQRTTVRPFTPLLDSVLLTPYSYFSVFSFSALQLQSSLHLIRRSITPAYNSPPFYSSTRFSS